MNKYSAGWRLRRTSKRHAESIEPQERWLISYADLVTLLFTLFVVLYAAADRDRASLVAEAVNSTISRQAAINLAPSGNGVLPSSQSLSEAQAAMEQALATNNSLRARARIIGTKDGFIVSMAEAGFFAPGEATIKDDARSLIEVMADTLRNSKAKLRVEGHTDALPIATARYPSNWELSSARASMVLAQLTARGISPTRLSLAGYAGERPIADNNTTEGRAMNRRVDLVILRDQP